MTRLLVSCPVRQPRVEFPLPSVSKLEYFTNI
jgi:hypothetical protein